MNKIESQSNPIKNKRLCVCLSLGGFECTSSGGKTNVITVMKNAEYRKSENIGKIGKTGKFQKRKTSKTGLIYWANECPKG